MTQRRMNRRRFLLVAGGALVASALACGGLTALASRQPEPEIEFITSEYGEENSMNERILVAYASQHGATAGIADAIGQTISEAGAAIDVRRVQEVTDLSPYRAAVIGSAIHSGKWMPEAMEFVQAHQAELSRMPSAIFLVCGMLASSTTPYRDQVPNWLEPVRALVHPVAEGHFAGAILYKNYKFMESLGMRVFAASIKIGEGDYRDWDAIRAWAAETRPLLLK